MTHSVAQLTLIHGLVHRVNEIMQPIGFEGFHNETLGNNTDVSYLTIRPCSDLVEISQWEPTSELKTLIANAFSRNVRSMPISMTWEDNHIRVTVDLEALKALENKNYA